MTANLVDNKEEGWGRLHPVVGRLRPGVGRLRPGVGRLRPGVGRLRPGVGRLRPGVGRLRPAVGRLRPVLVSRPRPAELAFPYLYKWTTRFTVAEGGIGENSVCNMYNTCTTGRVCSRVPAGNSSL